MDPEVAQPGRVRLDIRGAVALITLDDPDRRNVLAPETVAGICEAFDHAEAHDEVRAAVVASSGRAFCAGAQLDTLLSAADGNFQPVTAVYDAFLRVLASPLMTIAAVNGPAVGAGMNLALACDIRLAGPKARFDARFAQLRLHPGGGHMWLLQRAVGYQNAALACLLSQEWSSDDALRTGLVASVFDDVVAGALELGSGMQGLDIAFARRLVQSFRDTAALPLHHDALSLETEAQRWSTTQPGFVRGVEAIKARIAASRS
jgi:enoyl-CoA hydratase